MLYLDEIDELITAGELDKAKKICEKYEGDSKVQLRIAKILWMQYKYVEAGEICKNYPNDIEMQSLLITILTKQGKIEPQKYEEAKEICKKYMDDELAIKSQYVKILIRQKEFEEVEKICNANIEHPIFVSQLIKSYIKQQKYEEAKKICEGKMDSPTIKSQYVTVLMIEGNTEKAKEICRESDDNNYILKSQLITMLMSEGKLIDARKIAEKYQNSSAIKSQLKRINKMLKAKREKAKDNKVEKEKTPFVNIIKTKIYMDDISRDFIEEIKNGDMDEWQKDICLMAIYKKRKENKNAEIVLKEAKKVFKNEPIKSKKLNSLSSYIVSNKQKMFDWNLFDSMMKWEIDEKYAEEIRNRREQEEKEKQEKEQEQVIAQKEEKINVETKQENKPELIEEEQTKVEELKIENVKKEEQITVKESNIIQKPQNVENRSTKTKKNKNKEKEKNKKVQKHGEPTMGEAYKEEFTKVKAQISIKANTSNINYIKEFNVVDNMEEKPSTDLRSKMQLVMYLRKYGMDKIAKESFKLEYEIYDLINQMMMYKRADSRYDDSKILEEIMEKVEKIDGNNEYIYELIEKAYKRNDEQR